MGGDCTTADVEEGANEVTDHMVEKATSVDAVDQLVVLDTPGGFEDFPDAVLFRCDFEIASGSVGLGGSEGGEVVFADNVGGGFGHGFGVERPVQGIHLAGEERRTDFGPVDSILIGFLDGAVAGMEVCGSDFC